MTSVTTIGLDIAKNIFQEEKRVAKRHTARKLGRNLSSRNRKSMRFRQTITSHKVVLRRTNVLNHCDGVRWKIGDISPKCD